MQSNLFQLTGVDLVVPVSGFEGAKSYPLGPSCRAPLFDDKEDILYIKSTDANGFPSIKAYKFEEIALVDNNSQNAVSLNDIRALIKEELGLMKEDLIHAQHSVSKYDNTAGQSNGHTNSTVNKYNGQSKSTVTRPNSAKQPGGNTKSLESNKE